MATIQELKDRLQTGLSLKFIAQSYTEISARKLKEIRKDVERNRSFFAELANLYHAIKTVAAEKYHMYSQKNGRIAIVLLTSNYRFYGALNANLVEFFIKETSSRPADFYVIGKSGTELLRALNFKYDFESLEFKRDLPTNEELKILVSKLSPYKQILIVYPEFSSILIQKPVVKDITESQNITLKTEEHQSILQAIFDRHPNWTDDYIFEPSIVNILEFFDTQIITLLTEEAFLESELAKTAARLVTMDQAQINAEAFISTEKRDISRTVVSMKNAHLLETFISKQQKYTLGHAFG